MRIKSYFAHTVEDAMAMARQELGPDAMLVNSRKAPPEARHLGEYEVVFATDLPAEGSGADAGAGSSGAAVSCRQPGERLARELAELKKELEGMRRTLRAPLLDPLRDGKACPAYRTPIPYFSAAI